jgi:hypothetical protein
LPALTWKESVASQSNCEAFIFSINVRNITLEKLMFALIRFRNSYTTSVEEEILWPAVYVSSSSEKVLRIGFDAVPLFQKNIEVEMRRTSVVQKRQITDYNVVKTMSHLNCDVFKN